MKKDFPECTIEISAEYSNWLDIDHKQSKLFHITKYDEKKELKDYTTPFTWHHQQNCCEQVYVDLAHETTYLKQLLSVGQSYNKMEYRTCPWDWFMIKFFDEYNNYIWHIYYPCYNKQNWCYSDNLTLTIDGKDYQLNSMNCLHEIYLF